MPTTTSSRFARSTRFLRSPMFPIFMIVFVDILGLGITLPVLPLYAESEFNASALQITLLASMYFGAQFIASPRLGRLSDRVGRRPVLIISQIGTLLALLLSGMAWALPILYLARAIDGITGGNVSVAQAYLSDITDEKNRARGLGIVNAGFGAGFIFGPAFGGLVAAHYGPRVPFFAAACVSVVTILLSYFLLPESLTPERRGQDQADKASRPAMSRAALLRLPGLAIILALGFSQQFAFLSFQSTYVLWIDQVVLAGHDARFVQLVIGGALTLVGIFVVIAQAWLVGPLVRRYGEKTMVAGGFFIRALGLGIMSAVPFILPMLLVIPLLAIGGGVAIPALLALLTYAAPPGQRGYAIGMMESAQGLGRILGPILAGWMFQTIHPTSPMVLAAGLTLVTSIGAMGLWNIKLEKASAVAASPAPAD